MSKPVVPRLHGEMNAALRKKYETIRALLAHATAHDVRTRYQAGAVVLEIKRDPERYGKRGVTLIATALGKNEATLYRYGVVAECWTGEELDRLLARVDAFGKPLSWCHLLELSSIRPAKDREAWIERTLRESLSVRELARLLHAKDASAEGENDARTIAREIAAASERARTTLVRWDADRLTRAGAPESAEARQEVLDLLGRAVAAQAAIAETCAENVRKLDAARARLSAAILRAGRRS